MKLAVTMHTFHIESTSLWNGFESPKVQDDESFLRAEKGSAQSTLHRYIHTSQKRSFEPTFAEPEPIKKKTEERQESQFNFLQFSRNS